MTQLCPHALSDFISASAQHCGLRYQSCDTNIEETSEWGLSAGYATIQGVVKDSSGAVFSNATVLHNFCLWTEQDLLASDTLKLNAGQTMTDAEGRYEMDEYLPPVGLFPAYEGDTLQLECEMIVVEDSIGATELEVKGAGRGTVTFHREEEQKGMSVIDVLAEE